ncbi:hypothetical protein D0T84_20190 [Dysgonomonas sp. 521]|uniref:peptidylprolyl isomerase n=1 Tax=Dysgonomonas sp. 521 TaxID=2302932 RepID=UPI0013D387A2|nr:peptidylprolyl isomerase [Dysgonomonas sp. 521]NDV97204.1 hypothetical protein [Dysgonomonas sp. 521]
MNKKLFLLPLITLLATFCLFAQQADPVAIKINGTSILRSELERAYKKSNELRAGAEKESIADFVKSYVDFRLNVEEAKAQRLDTTMSYKRDLSAARVETSYKYMQDTVYENDYLLKIYERMRQDVEINHILLPFESEAVLPADTLVLYNKARDLYERLSKNGFAAEGYDKSLPTSVILDYNRKNGYMGWVTPFMFSAKVEDAIYTLPMNKISEPVRASDGYHIVQVLNRRPAIGTVDVEQVLFNFSHIPPDKHQIDSVGKVAWREYNNIHSANDFQSLCDEFSHVMEMGDKGCHFGVVGLDSRISPTFINAAFNLEKEGDISEPVWSDYGYHIIRLLKKIPLPPYSDMRNAIRNRVLKSDKSQEMTAEKRSKMAAALNFVLNRDVYNKLNNIANDVSPRDSAFFDRVKNRNEVLFSFDNGKEQYNVGNFLQYIQLRQSLIEKKSDDAPDMSVFTEAIKTNLSTDVLREFFNAYFSRSLTDYYYLSLADREPEYKQQLDEISEGLLSFAVMNKNVWERSVTDEKGLSEYFNKNKHKYTLSGTKYRGLIIHAKNEKALETAEALAKKGKKRDALILNLRNTLNKDSVQVLMEPGTWVKGENKYVDNKIFGGAKAKEQWGYPFFLVTGEFISQPQDYTDVRSAVEPDYQDQLEKDWRMYLHNKYKVEVDNGVLETIK